MTVTNGEATDFDIYGYPRGAGGAAVLTGSAPETPAAQTFELLNVVDLATVSDEPPAMQVMQTLVRGHHHLIYGEKEGGKTWYALAACARPVLGVGGVVVWIDREMDPTSLRNRLGALGVTDFGNFKYLNNPTMIEASESREQWVNYLALVNPAVVIVDAQAGALASAGLNENSTGDVLEWDSWFLAPARKVGATTVMLDHVGHEEKGRARGAYGKGAAAKVELLVETKEPFDRERVGRILITRKKNTLAAPIPETQSFRLGGSPFMFSAVSQVGTLLDGYEDSVSSGAQTFMRVVADCRREIEANPEGLTITEVKRRVVGKDSMIGDALAHLHADPAVPIEAVRGSNNSTTYRVVSEKA